MILLSIVLPLREFGSSHKGYLHIYKSFLMKWPRFDGFVSYSCCCRDLHVVDRLNVKLWEFYCYGSCLNSRSPVRGYQMSWSPVWASRVWRSMHDGLMLKLTELFLFVCLSEEGLLHCLWGHCVMFFEEVLCSGLWSSSLVLVCVSSLFQTSLRWCRSSWHSPRTHAQWCWNGNHPD